jgi:nitrogen fixation/metabolism regulation signal transduction histidine kinase
MKTLRGKMYLFVALLLILPSLPLSYFVLQLLERSYRIGVNERVESALDGALQISADLYQMHKSQLQSLIQQLTDQEQISKEQIEATLKGADFHLHSVKELDFENTLISIEAINRFLKEKNSNQIWPSPDHQLLYALARVNESDLLQIAYPLPESFQQSASQIQEVNQIYKTLSFARTDIRRSFLFTFLTIYGIGIVISLMVSYRISKKITQPIEQLTAATYEIGKGNLNYRINISGHDEFALLASSFNRMVKELSENQKKIIELEKMATWQQLARRLAHEIKNPLTPIQLMAQQMRDSYRGDDLSFQQTLSKCHEIIDEEVESLKKLVREFSDFARLPEFQIELQSLNPLIDTIKELYQQNNLKAELPEHEIIFKFDHEYLKRSLINLVENAIASSRDESPILLKVDDKDNHIEIIVADQGEGIAPEHREKIFEPYFSTKRSGVGLGLPIVKKIIEEHQGEINVASIKGKGTTVKITLPK